IRQRNIVQQLLRDGVEPARGNDITGKGQMGRRIENLDWPTGLHALRKIALPLEAGRNGGDGGVGVSRTRAEIAEEEERRRIFDQFRNHQRAAGNYAEAALRIRGLSNLLAGNGKRMGIEGRVIQIEEHHAMNAVGLAAIAELSALRRAIAATTSATGPATP